MRVLLVEDDETTRQSIELMLRAMGYGYDSAETGESAVTMALREPYDAILLDVMLPGMDGYEVIQQLLSANVSTPIILQSGLVDRDKAVKGLSLGVSDYLLKPYDRQELEMRIENVLRRPRPQLPPVPAPPVLAEIQSPEPEPPVPEASAAPEPVVADLPDEAQVSEEERRGGARNRVIKGGQIIYRAATCVMDCVILNLSDRGAALQPAEIVHCPQAFVLQIQHGPRFRCEVCWRYRNKVGVRFLDG